MISVAFCIDMIGWEVFFCTSVQWFVFSSSLFYGLSRRSSEGPGLRFNIKMSSYQYRKSHRGDKKVVRSSYLHNGISYTGKMSSLYWIGAQMTAPQKKMHPKSHMGHGKMAIVSKTTLSNSMFWSTFVVILIQISFKLVARDPINNKPRSVYIMAWHQINDM